MYPLLLPRHKEGTELPKYFGLLWPCIMNVEWRDRNQQDATNLMFIIKLLSQHVSDIIMPIIRRTRVCTAACGVLHWLWWLWLCGAGTQAVCIVKVNVRLVHTACVPAPHNHSHHNQCRTPYAAVHTLVLLMMGIMMSETCWDKSLIINIRLVASCWFFSIFTLPPKYCSVLCVKIQNFVVFSTQSSQPRTVKEALLSYSVIHIITWMGICGVFCMWWGQGEGTHRICWKMTCCSIHSLNKACYLQVSTEQTHDALCQHLPTSRKGITHASSNSVTA